MANDPIATPINSPGTPSGASRPWLFFVSIFVVATCGLIYELLAGTLASYLLGDSVTQFSTIIGTYLFAMGIGSWLSRYLKNQLLHWFILIELLVGLVGGWSAATLFLLFNFVQSFSILLYSIVVITGTLVGLELPLLMRILQNRIEFSDLVSRLFTFDYIGALFASLLFPLVLVPQLGILRTAFFFGALNIVVAVLLTVRFRAELKGFTKLLIAALICLVSLLLGFIYSQRLNQWAETQTYAEQIIYAKSSPYQRVVLTRSRQDLRLYLNGNLQFSSRDEYRYHEALVHPPMTACQSPAKILILGGGDGLAVREVLRYPAVQSITLVDLDPMLTQLFTTNPLLTELNQASLSNPKVKVVNADAFVWVRQAKTTYDVIIIDFPDPNNYALGKLYTSGFYQQVYRLLAKGGAMVVQSTSPYVARKSFWIINHTLQEAGFQTAPYHCYVPSFGEWGFILSGKSTPLQVQPLPDKLRFLTSENINALYGFPPDMMEAGVMETNSLNNQVLVNTFEQEWSNYIP